MRNHERQHVPELPAGFSTETCVVVSCRTCQDFYGDDEEGGIIHFRGLDEAAEVVAKAGWWVTVQGVQCRHCAAAEACATLGHAWPRTWSLCDCHGRLLAHAQQMEYRVCACCGESQERVAHPVGGA